MTKFICDLILKADDISHKRRTPKWLQRRLCFLLDLSCGMTWGELRRERRERRGA